MAHHDKCHDFTTYAHCWCMCSACWLVTSPHRRNEGKGELVGTGSCICRECPCPRAGPRPIFSIKPAVL